MEFKPRPYQDRMRRFLIRNPRAALFVDMGLGKTVTVLTAFQDLVAGLEVSRMLVVAPIRVCESTWPEEIKQWEHTSSLSHSLVRGSPVSKLLKRKGKEFWSRPNQQAINSLAMKSDITCVNFELLPDICEWLSRQPRCPWDWLVVDESTKMKSHSARRFKLLKPHLHRFKRWTIMSGTPMPNSYQDLWAQIYLLDRGRALGEFWTHFKDRWFDTNPWSYETKIKEGAAKEIERRIAPYVLCLKSEDYIKLPPIIHTRIAIDLPPKLRKQYDELEKEMFLKLEEGEVEALNAASLSGKCRQYTSGAMYETLEPVEADRGGPKSWLPVHDLKTTAAEEIVDSAQGDPTIIMYEFRHELERLRKLYPKAPYIGGGAKDSKGTLQRWNRRELPVLLAHPDSLGHGLNLQHGGRRIIWMSMTWNRDSWEQTIKRLHRSGQARPVLVYRVVCKGTVDEAVEAALRAKGGRQAGFLSAMRAYRASKNRTLAYEHA